MKKLNLILKLVVLSVFAGGLGLAGNGLNREVCAMENATHEDLEESLNDLQKEIENAGFAARYEDLRVRIDNGALLNDGERETAVEQCNTILKEIENYLNEYDNLGKDMKQFCNTVPDRYYAVGDYLREIRSKFYELREALSNKVGNLSEKPKETGSSSLPHIIGNLSEKPKEMGSSSLPHIIGNPSEKLKETGSSSLPHIIGNPSEKPKETGSSSLPYSSSLYNNAEKSFEDLKNKIKSSKFSEEYKKLWSNFELIKKSEKDKYETKSEKDKAEILLSNFKESELERCEKVLDAIERFESELDNIKIGPLGGSKLEEIRAIEKDLNDKYYAFIKIYNDLYDDLSKKGWVPEKNKTIEAVNNRTSEIKLKDENDEKIIKLEKFVGKVDSVKRCISLVFSVFEDLLASIPEDPNLKKLEAFVEKFKKLIPDESKFKDLNEFDFINLNLGKSSYNIEYTLYNSLIYSIDENKLNSDQKSRIRKIRKDFSDRIKDLAKIGEDLYQASFKFHEKLKKLYKESREGKSDYKIKDLLKEIENLRDKLYKNVSGEGLYKEFSNIRNNKMIEELEEFLRKLDLSMRYLNSAIPFFKDLANSVPEDPNFEDVKAFAETYEKHLKSNKFTCENSGILSLDKDELKKRFYFAFNSLTENELDAGQKLRIEGIKKDFSEKIEILDRKKKDLDEIYEVFYEKLHKLYERLGIGDSLYGSDKKLSDLCKRIEGSNEELDKKFPGCFYPANEKLIRRLEKFLREMGLDIEFLESMIPRFKDLLESIPEDSNIEKLEAFVEKYSKLVSDKSFIKKSRVFLYNEKYLNTMYNRLIKGIDETKLDANQKLRIEEIKKDFSNKVKYFSEIREKSYGKYVMLIEKTGELNKKLIKNMSDRKFRNLCFKIDSLGLQSDKYMFGELHFEKSLDLENRKIIEDLYNFMFKMNSHIENMDLVSYYHEYLANSIPEDANFNLENVEAFVGEYSRFVRDDNFFKQIKDSCFDSDKLKKLKDGYYFLIRRIDENKLDVYQKRVLNRIKKDFSEKMEIFPLMLKEAEEKNVMFCDKVGKLLTRLGLLFSNPKYDASKIRNLYDQIRLLNIRFFARAVLIR